MSITVHDCLNLPSFHSSKLIAGKKGLDRIVSSVSVVEIPKANQEIKVLDPKRTFIIYLFRHQRRCRKPMSCNKKFSRIRCCSL